MKYLLLLMMPLILLGITAKEARTLSNGICDRNLVKIEKLIKTEALKGKTKFVSRLSIEEEENINSSVYNKGCITKYKRHFIDKGFTAIHNPDYPESNPYGEFRVIWRSK